MADGEHDFGSLGPYYDKLRSGYDFVFGSRFSENVNTAQMSFLRD